ncbi:MAG: leucyl/phenylalanyl-tRNA--protein transferase [Ignavibacteriales bacterium CG12_big_fil_rev_8_21_14_0_65_30_8]|nr:MAG: leucyl/phenylalanyl-tRNA--protein transferase [Ignavibacteriales bacterium CG12_big_fil_rev_8_21_14_0_65_30_8]
MKESSKKIKQILQDPEAMIRMYAVGAFPMADSKKKEINWYMPEIRTIIPLKNYNVPRSFKKFLKNSDFVFKYDSKIKTVIKSCAERKETWISDELIKAYSRMEKLGHVHSVETYLKNKLVGGLYGVTFRGAFFGESMFSKIPQASKAALVKLIEHLNNKNFTLLDVQYLTLHLKMFGAKEINFTEYSKLLEKAYKTNCVF